MSEEGNAEKVDWVVPVAKGANISKTPTSNLIKAAEQKGVTLDNIRKNEKGQKVADVYQAVVTGMPAPREGSKEK